MLDVSVIIINYNTLKMTDECICSVIEKTSGINYEIILVDNASSDGSKEYFSNDSRVKYIYNDENLGFGRANNKGIEIAQGRNILFLNSDTLLRNNAIKILSDFLDKNPKVGADKPFNVGHITDADLMVRRETLKSVGGYNERLFMYYEDTELCHRISRTGLAIVSCPEAEITHSKFYCSILHCSRVFFSILKMLSPNAHTRRRWKERMHYYKSLVK